MIYPPVDIPAKVAKRTKPKDTYYVTASRLAFKKHVDIMINAANEYGFKLKVIGSGRDEEALRELAGPTVEILGYVPDEEFKDIFKGATAFLNAAIDEEFGIAPVEAMGYGLPVIAYGSGGLLETVKPGKNGYLYTDHTPESLYKEIQKLEKLSVKKYEEMCKTSRSEAKKYTFDVFKKKMLELV